MGYDEWLQAPYYEEEEEDLCDGCENVARFCYCDDEPEDLSEEWGN